MNHFLIIRITSLKVEFDASTFGDIFVCSCEVLGLPVILSQLILVEFDVTTLIFRTFLSKMQVDEMHTLVRFRQECPKL